MGLKYLFEPVTVGNLPLRNRIIMPTVTTGFPIGEQLTNYFMERAKGGAGMIFVGICGIEKGLNYTIDVSSDDAIPGLRRVANAIKAEGARVGLQAFHPGRYEFTWITGRKPVSASDVPSSMAGTEKPRALTIPEIEKIEDEYAQAALRAKKAEFDAAEFIASAGYLISQFLSPATNKRIDGYGGSIENRLRFPLEIVERAKQLVGESYLITCRLSGEDMVPGGNTLEETKIIAKKLEDAGVVMFNVTGGWHESRIPQITMDVPRGGYVYLAEGIKKVLRSAKVVASNRINDPILADRIIGEGKADMVSMGRPLIADPELPKKAMAGRFEDIRTCVACNQGCFDHLFQASPITCMVNPMVGKEGKVKIGPASEKKKVLIVGGGPGGMEAALIAARRGHSVVLYEKSDRLGGQLNLASVPPHKEELNNVTNYLSTQIRKLGVKVELGKEANVQLLLREKPDVAIVATGASPVEPNVPMEKGRQIIQAWDVLAGVEPKRQNVVLVGGGGVGCYTAHYLAGMKGKKVTLVEMTDKIASDVGVSSKWILRKELKDCGVNVLTSAKLMKITRDGIVVKRDGTEETLKADSVVVALGARPNNNLFNAAKDKFGEVYAIGDCVKPRKALEAIHEGFDVALRI
nr:FAD-dependent oxidoreductase [Candidatus Njordarchaeota archaeon]